MKFKQKILVSALALGLVTSSVFVSDASTLERQQQNKITQVRAVTCKWVQENGYWYYYQNSVKQKGWIEVNGAWYYLNSNGVMSTGWEQLGGKWYYLRTSGTMVTGWQLIDNTYYYFESNGVMSTGWKQLNGKWYYLNNGGAMKTGWQQISEKWYYFYGSGVMATNTNINGWKINASGVGTPVSNNTNQGSSNNGGISNSSTIYVTPGGKSYHSIKNCATLKRSKKILSVSLSQAKAQGKSDPCNICVR